MAADITVVVADPARIDAVRATVSLPGRVMSFPTNGIGSAVASIRAYRPKTVAVDAIFADSPYGATFLDQVEALRIAGCTIVLLVEAGSRWTAIPRNAARILGRSQSDAAAAADPALITPLRQALTAVPSQLPVAVRADVSSTRRVPRFAVRDPLKVVVESGQARLVDISVLGAQIVSMPILRPRQKIKVALPDSDAMLNVVAQVAWSSFERLRLESEPYYRVGLEFAGSSQDKLEDYRRRHCIESR
jgi:PilZ domain-containing protein